MYSSFIYFLPSSITVSLMMCFSNNNIHCIVLSSGWWCLFAGLFTIHNTMCELSLTVILLLQEISSSQRTLKVYVYARQTLWHSHGRFYSEHVLQPCSNSNNTSFHGPEEKSVFPLPISEDGDAISYFLWLCFCEMCTIKSARVKKGCFREAY